MNNKITNIILCITVIIILIMDGLAIHDIFVDEPDLLYEFGILIVSVIVFFAIGFYVKQRKQKSPQTR